MSIRRGVSHRAARLPGRWGVPFAVWNSSPVFPVVNRRRNSALHNTVPNEPTAAEAHRHALTIKHGIRHAASLRMNVKVRFGSVARVAYPSYELSWLHVLSRLN